MPKPPQLTRKGFVYSQPTMCLHCHVVVEMFYEQGADPKNGAWECPQCEHKYWFAHWKIKKKEATKTAADKAEAA